VGADLDVMARDSKLMRGNKPFLFADMKSEKGKEDLISWLKRDYLFV
jgi:urease accessory protein